MNLQPLNLQPFTVKELRDMLQQEFGLSIADSNNIKGKKNLINKIEELSLKNEELLDTELDNVFDNLVSTTDPVTTAILSGQDIPQSQETKEQFILPSSPEWTDYVLGQLSDDEKIKDKNNPNKEYPTTDGLRRMVEKLMGPIVRSITQIHQVPSPDNERRATVSVTISVMSENLSYYDGLMEFSGAADVYVNNSSMPFSFHPVATAETKSEGRAYKKALKIKVSTYEEIDGGSNQQIIFSSPDQQSEFIKPDQITFIDTICQRMNINVESFIKDSLPDFNLSYNKIPYSNACSLLASLQDLQGKAIKEELQGYSPNW